MQERGRLQGQEGGEGTGRWTYRITNLRGRRESTGKRAKQMTKQTKAPRLQAPKMSNRSHRLTIRKALGQSTKSAHVDPG